MFKRLTRWLEPRQMIARSHWAEGVTTVEITARPFVIEATDWLVAESIDRGWLRGYRLVERDFSLRTTVYARPLPIWLFLRSRAALHNSPWWALRWLYRHSLIHTITPEGRPVRFRDLRLGRGKVR